MQILNGVCVCVLMGGGLALYRMNAYPGKVGVSFHLYIMSSFRRGEGAFISWVGSGLPLQMN